MAENDARDSQDPAVDPAAQRRNASPDDNAHDRPGEQKDEGEDHLAKAGKDQPDADDKPPLYRRPIFWIVVAVVATALLVGFLLYRAHARKYQATDDAFVDAHVVRIAAQTTGQLTFVAALDNRRVRRGQLLATIAPGQPETSLTEARATVAQAEAQVGQAIAQVDVARANLAQASANARVPLAEAQRASADYARYLTLRRLDPAAAAPTQIAQARAQATAANAQASAARKQVETAAANIAAAQRQVNAMQAQRRAAQARVSSANVTVSYLTIRAPIDGTLVNRQVNLGSYVAPGQQMMAIVPDDMWITANFKETQLTLIHPGLPVTIKVDAFPGQSFAGHVESIQRGSGQIFQLLPPQNASGNYVKVVQRVPVRIRFNDNSWRRFLIGPGMSVKPTVQVRQ